MYETDEDMQRLQTLLDESIGQAGLFLRQSFQMPEHSLSARQLVRLWQGTQTVALATVTRRGEPRVAPIGALLWRGRFYIPTVASAARVGHISRQPAISFTHYQENGLAIILHGEAAIIQPDHPDFAALETFQREISGQSVREWGAGVYLSITPGVIYTYARSPERYDKI